MSNSTVTDYFKVIKSSAPPNHHQISEKEKKMKYIQIINYQKNEESIQVKKIHYAGHMEKDTKKQQRAQLLFHYQPNQIFNS